MAVLRSLAFGLARLAASAVPVVSPAWADLTVRMPDIDFHAVDFEHDGLVPLGRKGAALSGLQSYTEAIGYGALPFWEIELEENLQAGSGQHLNWEATSLENTFQVMSADRFPLAVAIYAEYVHAHRHEEPDSVAFGPIIQKKLHGVFGVDSVHTLNVLLARDIGPGKERVIAFQYAWQSRLLMWAYASPAVEVYGFVQDLAHAGHFRQQEHLAGPAIIGTAKLPYGRLSYGGGYLLGLTPASSRAAVRWLLVYEISF